MSYSFYPPNKITSSSFRNTTNNVLVSQAKTHTQIISTTYFIIENLYSHVHKYSSHAKINDRIVQKHTNHINYLVISTHSLSRSVFLWPCRSASKTEKKHNKHAIQSRNPKIAIYFIQLFNSLRHVYWSSGSGKAEAGEIEREREKASWFSSMKQQNKTYAMCTGYNV